MSNSLSEDYLRWLAPQIRDEHDGLSHPDRTFWDLLTIMFEKEFDINKAYVPNDDNRIMDGLALRSEFCHSQNIRQDALKDMGPCSFLEVLIALSRRLAFVRGGNQEGWAWILLSNLDLHRMSDPLSRLRRRRVNDILDRCIMREYEPDGTGGFFPLKHAEDDQRNVELWYQMHAYVFQLSGRT